MGLIKTAIMTGGGIYAVKQLAASQNNRHSNQSPPPQQQSYYNGPPPPQGYWGPPAPGREHLGPVWHPYPPPPSDPARAQVAGREYTDRNMEQRVIESGRAGGDERVFREATVEREGLPVYERTHGEKN